MQFLKVGHVTHLDAGTGISVFLFERPATGAYWLCGSAPATHELHTLELDATITTIHGLVLTGGSAYGLSAVSGVMRWLSERHRGVTVPHGGVVPIVPAAAIYDLAYKKPRVPSAEDAYNACDVATENNFLQGQVGAGTGATIGKLVSHASRMTGGLGCAKLILLNGVCVLVYVVVNSVGDVRNASGHIIAGARTHDDQFANTEAHLLSGQEDHALLENNTTLVALFTNARFSKPELKRIAKMASAGIARVISPIFTRNDGDIIFCVSLGDQVASETVVGAMAAEVVREAIIQAVNESTVVSA